MSKINRRTILAASAAAALAPSQLRAQAWPAKPIRWVVPYTAGGLTDSVTRLTLEKMNVGQPFVVDNKPGANSLIGAEIVANAPPDGYTFLTVIAAHAANKTLYAGKLKFDPVTSFAPVSLVAIAPIMILVSNDLPVKTVGELIAYAKANPGKISFGSSGVGAAAHLTSELIMQVTGTKMVHVPYKGTAPALADLMSGNIQMLLDVPIGTMSQVKAGKVRALAMMSKERVPGADGDPHHRRVGRPADRILDLGDVHGAGRHAEGHRRSAGRRGRQGDEGRGLAQAAGRPGRDPRRGHAGRHGEIPPGRSREVGEGDHRRRA